MQFRTKNYRHPKWVEKAFTIRQRDKFTCTVCGEEGSRDAVDHDYYELLKEIWEVDDEYLHLLCDFCHKQTELERQAFRKAIGGNGGANWMDLQALNEAILAARNLGRTPKQILEIFRLAITPDPEFLKAMEREIKLHIIRRQTLRRTT